MRPHKIKTINTIFFGCYYDLTIFPFTSIIYFIWRVSITLTIFIIFHRTNAHEIGPSIWYYLQSVLFHCRYLFLFLFVCLFPSLFSLEFFFRFFLDTYCYSLLFVSCVPLFSCRVCIFIKLMSIHPSFVMNIDMLPIFLCFPPAYSVHCCRANSDCCCCYWIIVDGDRLKKNRFYA